MKRVTKWVRENKKKSIGISGLCFVAVLTLCFTWQARATEYRASLVAYGDNSKEDFRTAELLEIQTDGFAADAKLQYTVEAKDVDSTEKSRVVSNLTSPSLEEGVSIYGDARYLYIKGGNAWSGTLEITVEDQAGHEAHYTYKDGFKRADLSADLTASLYGMFQGEETSLKQILARGGVLDMDSYATEIAKYRKINENLTVTDATDTYQVPDTTSVEKKNIYLNGQLALIGIPKVEGLYAIVKKNGSATHGVTEGSGSLAFHVFQKPTLTVTDAVGNHQVQLTDGEENVTYYINGMGKTWTGDPLIYTGLEAGTTYQVACQYTLAGENEKKQRAVVYCPVTTKEEYTVAFDMRGIGTAPGVVSQSALKGDPISEPAAVEDDVYELKGWYTDENCKTAYDFATPVTKDFVLYAKWEKKKFPTTIDLKKGSDAWNGQTLTLRDEEGKVLYTLSDGGSGNYTSNQVVAGTYQVYVNGAYSKNTITVDASHLSFHISYKPITVQFTLDDGAYDPSKLQMVYSMGENLTGEQENLPATKSSAGNYEVVVPVKTESYDITLGVNGEAREHLTIADASAETIPIKGRTVKVKLQHNTTAMTGKNVFLKNGNQSYQLSDADSDGIYEAVIWETGTFKIYVSGMDSSAEVGSLTIADADPTVPLQTITYHTVTTKVDSAETHTYWIQKGKTLNKPAVSYAQANGKVFSHWSKTNASVTDAFSTSDIITVNSDLVLCANYEEAKVLIGDIKKDKSTSPYRWTFPNIAITGFTNTQKITGAVLEVNNGKITVSTTSGITDVKAVDDSKYVIVTFAANTSVLQAQALLRTQVTVKGADAWTAQNMQITIYY